MSTAAQATATTLSDYERAVRVSFELATAPRSDVASQKLKQDAATFLDSLRAGADSWRYSLELFRQTSSVQCQFYAMQHLQQLLQSKTRRQLEAEARSGRNGTSGVAGSEGGASSLDKAFVFNSLLDWMRAKTTALANRSWPAFVRTKLAVVLTLVIKTEYPRTIPRAFTRLMDLFRAPVGFVGNFCLLLQALSFLHFLFSPFSSPLLSSPFLAEHARR